MIQNCTVIRIDTPGASDAAGVVTRTAATVSIRGALVKPSQSQRTDAQASNVNLSAVLYLLTASTGNLVFAANQVLAVKLDAPAVGTTDAAAVEYWIRSAARPTKAGGLSNWELGLEDKRNV